MLDRDLRLIVSNRRYAEIYCLTPDQIAPGMTLRQICELRIAAGTCPMAVDDYLVLANFTNARGEADERVISLVDGRAIRVRHMPAPDGGWTSIHEDVTELDEKQLLLEERISLQSLIDAAPDNLWVKDAESRFVIANVATARRMGRASPKELIGKSDLELCPEVTARKFLADERDLLTAGRPMIDGEEYVLSTDGSKTWLATTKTPLRNERGEIVGIIGVSRDITRRRLSEALREGQVQILEMIALNAPLDVVLNRLVCFVEQQTTGLICSILLRDENSQQLRLFAASSLSEEHKRAIGGLLISPSVGSCGAVADRREPLVVADTFAEPLWREFRNLAVAHSLRSFQPAPILSSQGSVLGAIALYSRMEFKADAVALPVVGIAVRLAGIAIERKVAVIPTISN